MLLFFQVVYTMVDYQTRFQNGLFKINIPILVIASDTFTDDISTKKETMF